MLVGLSIFFLSATCEGPKTKEASDVNAPQYVVNGKLFIIEPYCGGAAPPRDKRINEAMPFANQELFIKFGNENDANAEGLIPIKTLEDGSFELKLPKGTYCLIRDYKNQALEDFLKQFNKEYDRFYIKQGKECYEKWWKSCDLSFEVTEEGATLEHSFRKRCFVGENPCIEYNGPMPP